MTLLVLMVMTVMVFFFTLWFWDGYRLPVACADRTCRATYFDCLKAIQLQDQQVLGASDTLTPLFSKLDIQNQQSIATGDEALLIHFSKASKLSVSAESDGQPLKRIE
eukprot:m.59020 g.59020  ORF g.59020 m.59020 type:complete len:108 (-) comp11742_c0_seq2:312-635(-)